MNRNAAIKTRAGSKEHYVSELRRNPDDPQTLMRLIRLLRKSDEPMDAAKFLKQLVTSPDFSKRSKTFRRTATNYTYNTFINLIDRELEAGRIQRAEKLSDTLISLSLSRGANLGQDRENIRTKAEDSQLGITHPFEKLLTVLLTCGKIRYTMDILGKQNCIVPYSLAVRAVQTFANNMNSRKLPDIAKHAHLLQKFMNDIGVKDNQETIISHSIYSNVNYPLSPWREKALSNYDLEEIQKWVEVSGIERLQKTHDKGKGIILVSCHMSTVRLLNLLLDRMGFSISSLEVRDRMGQFGIQTSNKLRVLELGEEADFPLRELYLVQKSLKKGEIVNMSGDGYKGTTGVTTHFLGREREFRTSFAELAIKSGATAFPVFGSANISGQISLEIKAPLKMGNKKMSHSARVESVVKQYSEILEDRWKNSPGDIAWEQIRYFSSLPAIGDGNTDLEENSNGL